MWFAVGVFVGVVAALALSFVVAPARIGILNLVIPLVGVLCGGAIAGRSLHLGRRCVVAFAVAFALALPILGLRLIGIQGMSGNEGFFLMICDFGAIGALAFALMGGVGVAIAGLGRRNAVRFAAIFGGAGFTGGFLLALSQAASLPGARDTNLILLALGSIAFIVLPAAVGGSVLKRRLVSHNRLNDPTA
jgi:hypothetical protein